MTPPTDAVRATVAADRTRREILALLVASTGGLLPACGGGGSAPPPAPTAPSPTPAPAPTPSPTPTPSPSPSPATFRALAQGLPAPRAEHAATLLANGQVLITGGFSAATLPAPGLDTALLYDPTGHTFSAVAGRMQSPRTSHQATRLADGRVLLTGGQDNNDGDGLASAEIYDPAAQTFTAVAAPMVSARGGHAAALLPDGTVLLAGGFDNSSVALDSAELFDPATSTFSAVTATLLARRAEHQATLLGNGKVLLDGGSSADVALASAELYDPVARTFSATGGAMSVVREAHATSLLADGHVLVSGGGTLGAAPPATIVALDSAELYDATTRTFGAVSATMTTRRFSHTQTTLADGSVLVLGGGALGPGSVLVILGSAEVYGP